MNDPFTDLTDNVPEAMPVMDGLAGLPHAFNSTGWIEPTNSDLYLLVSSYKSRALEIDADRTRYTFDVSTFDQLWTDVHDFGFQLICSPCN